MASYPPALSLGGPAPDSVVDMVGHRVLEARLFYGAVCAYASRNLDAYSIAWEECVRRNLPALSPSHPRSVHDTIVTCSAKHCYGIGRIRSKP